ncbi:MAG TPA: glycosyltransferase family 4 protein [Candidatus Bathyarchaeia archaeon]|nr:glycosyltransferase family 4 protein [Candidatus Bathyarchaeia archaeon]
MKILFLTKELPFPINSGARMRTWHYLRGLTQAGAVHLISCSADEVNKEQARVFREMGIDVVLDPKLQILKDGSSALSRLLGVFSPLPYAVAARRSKIIKQRVKEIAEESRCDVLICDGIHLALNVAFDVPCRKILDEHNVESTIIGRFFQVLKNPLARVYVFLEWLKFRAFEKKIWPRFDELHVCSEVDKSQVEKRCGHRVVHVVPNGVAIGEFPSAPAPQIPSTGEPGNRGTGARLVYSGLMGWRPNEDAALYFSKEIYPIIKGSPEPQNPSAPVRGVAGAVTGEPGNRGTGVPVEFFIVGKDPTPAVQQLAKDDPSIIVTGFVDDVKTYVMESDVVVVPLRMGSGTRLKILEAMAMGKPIVSTSIGAEGLDVTHGKDILIADDPEAFAQEVVQLLKDERLRQEIASAGRALVEQKYDWKLIEAELGELITRG